MPEKILSKNNKIIIILGPTSSGKSAVAISLAKKFQGEIISADSRQVYRGLDIGTGKEPGKWDVKKKLYISQNIPHYLIDNISPRTEYNAAKFKKDCDKIIADILKRGKLPIVCGGTGFWIKALVDNVVYPEVAPNWKLREKLNKKSTETLFKELQKLDPKRARTIDQKNPVRLIRAIEICKALGSVPNTENQTLDNKYQFLQIGISLSKEKLQARIKLRLQKRFSTGMISEVETLHFEKKLSWKKLESFGLGYKFIPQYLKKEIATKEDLFEKVLQSEKDYAKRQMTWFQKDKRIIWIDKYKEIKIKVKDFLK